MGATFGALAVLMPVYGYWYGFMIFFIVIAITFVITRNVALSLMMVVRVEVQMNEARVIFQENLKEGVWLL